MVITKIKSLDKIPLNVVEAIKRARMKSGYFPGNQGKPKRKESQLAKLTKKSKEVLFKANTVFPFDIFPDTIILDREKLTIINRTFFSISKTVSVMMADIQNAEANTGPFLGSIIITSKYFTPKRRSINFLTRADAIKLRRLLQGHLIANEREIDCSGLDKQRLVSLLEELGRS